MFKAIVLICILVLITSCRTSKGALAISNEIQETQISESKIELFDSIRNRKIPIIIYYPKKDVSTIKPYLVFISHGYGFNKGNPYLGYSFIAENLAKKGCYVVSIQHELQSDDLLSMEGEFKVTRKPNWEKGVQNIFFILNNSRKIFPNLIDSQLVLIGHSNGGDMSVLFAEMFPDYVQKVITLDHRRMPIPRVQFPKFYSLRSIDQPADEGVLLNTEEQKELGHIIVQTSIKHNDMCNNASKKEKKFILSFIEKQLFYN
jgi:predicted peptidase